MFQPTHDHAYGLTRSRLNRVYVNQHAVETLHKTPASGLIVATSRSTTIDLLAWFPRDKLANNKVEGTNAPLPYLGITHAEFLSRDAIVGKRYDNAPLA